MNNYLYCFIALYTQENSGSVTFPLRVQYVTGLYHYRIMVNYPGTSTHCVYESVPFMIIQDPYKRYVAAGPPKVITNPTYIFSQTPQLKGYDFPKKQ